MGDTGSMTLGYTMAFLAISFAMDNKSIKPFSEGAIVVALSTLIVPVFDVARVIIVRWFNKLPLFRADRSHLHHKLLRSGMSHQTAMMTIVGLSLFFCLFNILMVQYISNNIVVALDLVLWMIFTLAFNFVVNKKKEKQLETKPVVELESSNLSSKKDAKIGMPLVKKYNF